MSDLFTTHAEILRALCDEYAEQVADQPVRPLDWQGCHSYTVESQDGCTVIQFRSAESPLEEGTVKLAKKVHPSLVPTMEYLGFFDDTSVTVWKMDKVPGIGFGFILIEDEAEMKLAVAVTDMAEFYAQAWQSPQIPSKEQIVSTRQECETKLAELAKASSSSLLPHIKTCTEALNDVFKLPWVLTHDDLSSMNLIGNPATGNLTGVVDWVDATIWPFGKGLWGLESVLGSWGPKGYTWLDDDSLTYRKLFSATLQEKTSLTTNRLSTIEKARKLGLLLRYGFRWQDGGFILEDDTSILGMFLDLIGKHAIQ